MRNSSSIEPMPSRSTPSPRDRAVEHRLGDGLGLLVDLLEHERLVAALLGGLRVPVDRGSTSRSTGAPSAVMNSTPSGRSTTSSSFSMYWTSRVCAMNAGIAEATNCSPSPRPTISGHSRRAATTQVGLVGRHADEGVVAAQAAEGVAHGLDQPGVEVARDEVGDDLGVGLRGELGALGQQLLLELHVVLDDPVDDDVDAVVGVEVRVRVLLGDAPVGRPAGVADAGGGGRRERRRPRRRRLRPLDRGAQVREVADGAHRVEPAVGLQGDARGVVPAVLELLEAGQQDVLHRAIADVADDAAHASPFLVVPTHATEHPSAFVRGPILAV